jgi:hypothetical protein
MEAQQQFTGSAEWSALLQRAEAERHNDNEVREALIGVLARVVDEYRWGLRDITLDELGDLVDRHATHHRHAHLVG